MSVERLQKILSASGVCSRREAEKRILAGEVCVNGKIAQLGQSADIEKDVITVNGVAISAKIKACYLMLNKPSGYVTTLSDEKGRPIVTDLIQCESRVYPIGRLDMDSEGLLLLTNDGVLANKLMHPKHHVDKTYLVEVVGDTSKLGGMTAPMIIDGYKIHPAKVKILLKEKQFARFLVTIHEGRNRQVRKMCANCGLTVKRLRRIAIGRLQLDKSLAPGAWRSLTASEIAYLMGLSE